MIYIKKASEPSELTKERTKQICYNNISRDTKNVICKFLLKEQHGLCAYCMQKINSDLSKNHITIDHIKCRDRYPNLAMDYNNMVGACTLCNNHKGSSDIYINPTIEEDILKIKYIFAKGEIYSKDGNIQSSLNDVLRLNSKALKDSRLSIYKQFISYLLSVYNNRRLTEDEWITEKDKIVNQEQYFPFAGMLINYIDKKIDLWKSEED